MIPWQLTQVLVVGLVVGLLVVGLLMVRDAAGTDQARICWRCSSGCRAWAGGSAKRVQAAVEAVRAYSDKPGLIAWALVISMAANGLSIVGIYLYALAVGADVRLAEAAVVVPAVLAVGLLPISINGLGTIELTFVLLLGLMGVDPEVALAVAILRRLVLLGQSLVGGVLYSSRRFG